MISFRLDAQNEVYIIISHFVFAEGGNFKSFPDIKKLEFYVLTLIWRRSATRRQQAQPSSSAPQEVLH